jgi:hypothetical protein
MSSTVRCREVTPAAWAGVPPFEAQVRPAEVVARLVGRAVLLLRVAETPQLIDFQPLAWQLAQRFVLAAGADGAQVHP